MARQTRRTRRSVRAKPILFIGLVLNVYFGIAYSPLTSLRHIRVEGSKPFDEARIQADLKSVTGVPCLQINPNALESKILELPEVRSATLSRNIFGNGLLRMAYRTPVAQFVGSRHLALSDDGVVYAAHELPENLVALEVGRTALQPNLTPIGFWESGTVARLIESTKNIGSNQQHRIVITEPGEVNLYIGQGHVVLGDFKDLDHKLQVLRNRLTRNPSELSQVAELNLMAPDNPKFVLKSSESAQ